MKYILIAMLMLPCYGYAKTVKPVMVEQEKSVLESWGGWKMPKMPPRSERFKLKPTNTQLREMEAKKAKK